MLALVYLNQWIGDHDMGCYHSWKVYVCVLSRLGQPSTLGTGTLMVTVPITPTDRNCKTGC